MPGPVFRAMHDGKLARVEELTRIPSDVQDALITILSEKALPIPELDDEVQAVQGFNVIATANDRDRGVNELSCAMRRRFNTVVLPLPDTADEEVEIVRLRLDSDRPGARAAAGDVRAGGDPPRRDDLPRAAQRRHRGRPHQAQVAVRHAVHRGGDQRRHQRARARDALRRRRAEPEDVAGGLTGAVVQDPVADKVVWQEYLEAVVRERDGWGALYRACRAL